MHFIDYTFEALAVRGLRVDGVADVRFDDEHDMVAGVKIDAVRDASSGEDVAADSVSSAEVIDALIAQDADGLNQAIADEQDAATWWGRQ